MIILSLVGSMGMDGIWLVVAISNIVLSLSLVGGPAIHAPCGQRVQCVVVLEATLSLLLKQSCSGRIVRRDLNENADGEAFYL